MALIIIASFALSTWLHLYELRIAYLNEATNNARTFTQELPGKCSSYGKVMIT
ncbi:hypothetical protein [Aliamphritea spongicola]|nr:hypothetical protein [Aliamphritea spongicola]